MKSTRLIKQLGMIFSSVFVMTTAYSGIPVWSFVPNPSFPPKITVTTTSTATVKYTVVNNSRKPHHLVIKPQRGITQETPCALGPRGSVNSSCTLVLTVDGSLLPRSGVLGGPVLCQTNPNGTPNPNLCSEPLISDVLNITVAQGGAILSAPCDLALSVTGLTLNGLPSGQPRTITITNTGDHAATELSISYPTFPGGTTHSTTCGTTLDAGSSCGITITPGSTATSGLGNLPCTTGIAPVPGVVTVSALGGVSTQTTVEVVSYGCIYQGGYIYAMTETVDTTEGIGGSVVSVEDQAAPGSSIWSSNGANAATVSYNTILGIDETSTVSVPSPTTPPYPVGTPAFVPCNGNTDGSCDSGNIVSYYNANRSAGGAPPTPAAFYAAGLCTETIDGYSDWYLPALCQLGPTLCPAGIPNIINSLPFLIGDAFSITPSTSCPLGHDCLAGEYWSSTELAASPQTDSWFWLYSVTSFPGSDDKAVARGVRCSRNLDTVCTG